MRTDEFNAIIEMPTNLVFDFLIDQSTLHTWLPGLISSEVIGGGPVKAGSLLAQVRNQGGREMKSTTQVVTCESPRIFAVKCFILGVETLFYFLLEGEGPRTRVTLRSEYRGHGLSCMMEPVVAAMCRGCNEQTLRNLQLALDVKNVSKRVFA